MEEKNAHRSIRLRKQESKARISPNIQGITLHKGNSVRSLMYSLFAWFRYKKVKKKGYGKISNYQIQ